MEKGKIKSKFTKAIVSPKPGSVTLYGSTTDSHGDKEKLKAYRCQMRVGPLRIHHQDKNGRIAIMTETVERSYKDENDKEDYQGAPRAAGHTTNRSTGLEKLHRQADLKYKLLAKMIWREESERGELASHGFRYPFKDKEADYEDFSTQLIRLWMTTFRH